MTRAVTTVRYRARISSGSAVLVASIALVLTVILPAFPRMSPLTFLACFEVGTICLIFEIIIVSCMGKSNVCDMGPSIFASETVGTPLVGVRLCVRVLRGQGHPQGASLLAYVPPWRRESRHGQGML